MTLITFKPCRQAVLLEHWDLDKKQSTYKTLDTGLYYGEPILEENRTYNALEYGLIRLRMQKLEGYKTSEKWIKIKSEKTRR